MASIAGIAVSNSGTVTDCYTIWDKSSKTNKILISSNTGTLTSSALIVKNNCDEIYDASGRSYQDYPINKTSDIKKLGWDTATCWQYAGDNNLIKYNENTWHTRVTTDSNAIHISSIDDYILFADKINNGDKKYIEADVVLDSDLDFKGKSIPIVGKSRATAFAGTFDGRDHLIWNGTIKDDTATYVGLFGYLKGTVVNLTFDGRVQSDKNLAGLCGLNMGRISCCGSVVRLKPKDERYSAAGIVADNEGTIDKCYALLQRQIIIPPFVYVLLIAALVVLLGILGYFTIVSALNMNQEYARIDVDPGQVKQPDDGGGNNGENALSFSLYENVSISRNTNTCNLNFVNPSRNANKIVVELQVINSAGERVTVGRSKAVMPGYGIMSLPITNPDALTGSETKGYIVLVPYNVSTEAKGFVETELPVTIIYSD